MVDKSIAQAQLEQLKTKLNASINSRAALEEDFKKQSTLLIQFISKLSITCKGLDLELDNRLAKFRVLLTKSAPISDIEAEIKRISKLLAKHTALNESNIRELHNNFHQAGSILQKVKGMPPQARRHLRTLLTENADSKDALVQYIPKLDELLSIYQQVLVAKNDIKDSPTTEAPSGTSANEYLPYIKQILKTLDSFTLSNKQQSKIDEIKKALTHTHANEEVLSNIVKVFNIILADIDQERQAAKAFLSTLSGALSKVQRAVKSTITGSEENQQAHTKLNNILGQHVTEMINIVESSPSLNQAKTDLNQKLEDFAKTIAEKSNKEIEYFASLKENMSNMQIKVQELEKQSILLEKRLQEQQKKSMQDALTKLNNRAAFDEHIAQEMVRFHQTGTELAIVVVDLDDFKRINDTYGHSAGDKTLQVISGTLAKNLDDSVFIARYGGEEFVLVFNKLNKDTLLKTLDTLRKKVASLPFKFKNNRVSITLSIGATHVQAGDNVHLAFERADQALYQAKNNGKNQVIYD